MKKVSGENNFSVACSHEVESIFSATINIATSYGVVPGEIPLVSTVAYSYSFYSVANFINARVRPSEHFEN